jgi:hypothetical protein
MSRVHSLMLLCLSSGFLLFKPRPVLLGKLSVVIDSPFEAGDSQRVGPELCRDCRQADLGGVPFSSQFRANSDDRGVREMNEDLARDVSFETANDLAFSLAFGEPTSQSPTGG